MYATKYMNPEHLSVTLFGPRKGALIKSCLCIVNSVVLVLYGAYQLQLVAWDGILDMMSFSEIVWKAETRWSNLVGWVDG